MSHQTAEWITRRKLRAVLAGIAMAWVPAWCLAQTPSGYTISTVAGNGTSGFSGDGSAASGAELAGPIAVAVDASHTLYIVDQFNHRVREVAGNGNIATVAGNGTGGFAGDGGHATSAELDNPSAVAVDAAGNFFIADTGNNVVRKVTGSDAISTAAGNNGAGAGYSGDGAAANKAQLNGPRGVAVDAAGNLYIADTANNCIREVAANGNISTIAGTTTAGFSGDGGAAIGATLNAPTAVAVDGSGNLYIADTGNNRIRKVAGGILTTVAGNGVAGFAGDNGLAAKAALNHPLGMALDASGNLYFADSFNGRIRRIGANGIITTVAGNGKFADSGDGGIATAASLYFPSGVALDSGGNLYVADTDNSVVRLLTPPANPGALPAIQAGGVISAAAFGGFPAVAPGSWIEIYGTNLAADSRPWTSADFRGPNAPISLDGTSVTIGGQPAFVAYISPGQVNAQVPSNLAAGAQPLTVTTAAGTSDLSTVTVNASEPGLLAPAAFNLGGTQYAVALLPDGAYALPAGAIPGATSRPARPGETLTLYGIGFGSVSPNTPAGQTTMQSDSLVAPLDVSLGSMAASVSYAGLAPTTVGLYQFNVVVPNLTAGGAVPLSFSLAGTAGAQTLYIAVQN